MQWDKGSTRDQKLAKQLGGWCDSWHTLPSPEASVPLGSGAPERSPGAVAVDGLAACLKTRASGIGRRLWMRTKKKYLGELGQLEASCWGC